MIVHDTLSEMLGYGLVLRNMLRHLGTLRKAVKMEKEAGDLWAEQRTQNSFLPLKLWILGPYREYWIYLLPAQCLWGML